MPLRILHIANTQFFIERLLQNKLIGLQQAGCEIITAAAPAADNHSCPFPFHPISFPRGVNPWRNACVIRSLIRLLRKEKPDIVHTHASIAGFDGRLAAHLTKIPCVHTVHGLPFYEGQKAVPFYTYKALEKLAANWSRITFSQNRGDLLTMKKLRFNTQLLFEGNGVDVSGLIHQFDRENARSEFSFTDEQVVIGFFARLEPIKGHFLFIQVLEQLVKTYPNVVALVGGTQFGQNAQYADRVKSALQNDTIKDHVRFLGFREDVPRLLSGCDMLVLPSQKEGIPRIIMEAMAIGLPIVATDVPGTRELVTHSVNGLLSPYNEPDKLLQNLMKLTADPKLRKELGSEGYRTICAHFDESQVIARILSAYNQISNQVESDKQLVHI